ncbi:acyl-CoA synthetase (AMP-forming)/AMP-acid ligase II [Allocatelliglobosispora scoriae]|uniref:Acyl-CoA synthetase (AMP-forming)/AMP-acid ligase II n=1 Tax=Allocatelliglobosispora scoriae TaxID=643052 RepID=A0A841BL76_9ACTN|nr:acyl-CoA synthetase (AMP-forming)/AMP-acid ligase II [Allocatelliglobosispora scoriae]
MIDAASGAELGGDGLRARIEAAADATRGEAGLILLPMPTTVDAVLAYLGALAARRPVALIDPQADVARAEIIERFAPSLVVGVDAPPPSGYAAGTHLGLPAWHRPATVMPDPELALLLTTSGSTGSPKLVRLSSSAVDANARAIAEGLGLGPDDVAMTTLPLFYTYGLSVLNSHLVSGATVVLTERTFMEREFWTDLGRFGVTSLAAVPYQYEMLKRLRFTPAKHPTLRTLTQAGGRLRTELVADFRQRMAEVGGKMFVMYGQTEATARMTILPSEMLAEKLGSAGPALPGGKLRIDDDEVVFEGPNVMMGYAEQAEDLAKPDELGGVLRTGDLGRLDDDGYLWITGRVKRLGKVFGVRVNLDDVERMLAGDVPVAAIAGDDRLIVFVETLDTDHPAAVKRDLAEQLGIHSSGLDVRGIAELPLMSSGKIDYRALEEMR